jgi:hypothetical protein
VKFTLCIAGVIALVASPAALGSGGRTINAIAKSAGITFVDADRSGKPSIGDYEIGKSVYVNPTSGKVLGRGSVVCTQTDAAGVVYQCQGVTHFAGGDIVTAGPFTATAKSVSLAVVGGTGVYAGTNGLLTTTWLDSRFARAKVAIALD